MLNTTDKKKLTELKNSIDSVKAELRRLETIQREEYIKYSPKAKYVLNCITLLENGRLRIGAKILNLGDKEEFMALFDSINGDWKEQRVSVAYFRVSGVLLHEGGGWVLLNDQQACSDEEWAAIKEGNIPEKFRNSNIDY